MLRILLKISIPFLITTLLFGFTNANFRFPGPNDLKMEKEVPVVPEKLQEDAKNNPNSLFRVWVFFTDKGIFNEDALNSALKEFSKRLTPRCLKRRMKVRSKDNLVDFRDLPVREDYIRSITARGAHLRVKSKWLNAISVEVKGKDIIPISNLPFVRAIRRVHGRKRDNIRIEWHGRGSNIKEGGYTLSYGPSFNQLMQIEVPLLHELGYTGEGVMILMLDTGFRRVHESLQHLNIVAEHDFINDDDTTWNQPGDPDNQDHHGTITLSTIAGYSPGNLIGPAFNASFLLAKTEDVSDEQPIEEDYWVAGLEWGDSLGADIVSSSLGYINWYTYEDLNGDICVTTVAADMAAQNGILVVNAMGNSGPEPGSLIAPADADSIVAVGAVDSSGNIAYFSSRGPTYDGRIKPEICAQGVSTFCAYPGDYPEEYLRASGTSLSTPLIAGLCALLLEAHPDWGPMDIRQALLSTGTYHNNPNNDYGWGIAKGLEAAGIQVGIPILQSATLLDTFPEDNPDGTLSPGERATLTFTLYNVGNSEIPFLEGMVHSDNPHLLVIDSTVSFGAIQVGDSLTSNDYVVIKVPQGFYVGFRTILTLQLTDSTRTWERNFHVTVHSTGDWIKSRLNPFIHNGENWYAQSILNGCIVSVGDTLKVWFSGLDKPFNEGGIAKIGYTYSIDLGETWNTYPEPVLEPSLGWDSQGVTGPCIINSGDSLIMLFVGFNGYPGSWYQSAIGIASSHDGIHWVKREDPIIQNTNPDAWDYNPIGKPSLIYSGDSTILFYCGIDSHGRVTLGKAMSRDLVNWTYREPLFSSDNIGDEYFDDLSLSDPNVIKTNVFILFHSGKGNDGVWRIGGKTSLDGFNWSYIDGPGYGKSLLDVGLPGAWDELGVKSPSVARLSDGRWVMLYRGEGANGDGLGLAFSTATNIEETSLRPTGEKLNMLLSPIPTSGKLSLFLDEISKDVPLNLKIYNVSGREILKAFYKHPSKEIQIDLSGYHLPRGLYFISLESGDYSSRKKFIYLP